MAKGQMKSNKEVRKPKADKAKAAAPSTVSRQVRRGADDGRRQEEVRAVKGGGTDASRQV